MRDRIRPSLFSFLILFVVLGPSPGARADQRWAYELPALRAALATYDLEGDATFNALVELGRVASGQGEGAREARALRALVAADLLVIARSHPSRGHFDDRVAESFGISTLELAPRLIRDLESVHAGVYRAVTEDALLALALIDEVDVPIPVDWSRHGGLRRDILFLQAAATGALDAGAAFDPCADTRAVCAAPWSSWDAPTRARVAALREASAAAHRLATAARNGDPLVQALSSSIQEHRARVEAARVDPTVWVADGQNLMPAQPGDSPIRVDRLLVVGRDSLVALHTPPVTVRDGEVVSVEGDGSAGLEQARFEMPPPEASLEAPLRSGLGTMVRGGALAVALTGDVTCEVVWRVLGEARRLGVGSVALVRRAADGSLAGEQIQLVGSRPEDAAREVVIRVRPAYLVIERDSESSMIERTRGEGGLLADLPELERAVRRASPGRVSVTFAGDASAADIVQIALTLAHEGRAPVGLAMR